MQNIILAVDYVNKGLIDACLDLEKVLDRKLTGIRLVSDEYGELPAYKVDNSGFFQEINIDYDNNEALQKLFKPIKNSILTVSCVDEASIKSLRKIIPFLPNLSLPNESSLLWATEKNHMRDMLSFYDKTLVPNYVKINREELQESLENVENKLTFPVIVKPCGLQTSILVSKCSDIDELKSKLVETFSVIDKIYSDNLGNGIATVLVEEFIVGEMYSIDAYVSADAQNITFLPTVRVITSHDMGLKGFYGYDRIIPSGLDPLNEQGAQQAAEKAIRALNLRSTTAHVELFKTAHGWKIIELGARVGGSREEIYSLSYGIKHHFNDLALRIGDIEPVMPRELLATTVCAHIYPENSGEIINIEGLSDIKNLETVKQVRVFASAGDFAANSENGGLLVAEIILSDQDKEKVISDAKLAHKLIEINI